MSSRDVRPSNRSAQVTRLHDLGVGNLFEAVPDSVIAIDIESQEILLWNPAAAKTFGYTEAEAIGMPMSRLLLPEEREERQERLETYRRTGWSTAMASGEPIELPLVRRDGREMRAEMTVTPLGPGDPPRYLLAILRDITERTQLFRALEDERRRLVAANRDLSRANETLQAFTYLVSHDLKEPIRGIDALLEDLSQDYEDSMEPDARDLVQRAARTSARLRGVVDGLLLFSRSTLGEVRLEPLDVVETLRTPACRLQFEGLMEERNGEVEIAERLPRVMGAPAALCQVIGNLVTNAIKHNPSPHPRVRITGHRIRGERVELLVHDNGPGFPPNVLAHFRAGGGPMPGVARAGFGLTIANRTVERLGGSLALDNPPGGGGLVRILLRAAPEKPD